MALYLLLAVLVHVGVRLNRILLDQKLDALIERRRHRGRLLAQQHFDWIVGGETHNVLGAGWMRTAFAVWTIGHTICAWIELVVHFRFAALPKRDFVSIEFTYRHRYQCCPCSSFPRLWSSRCPPSLQYNRNDIRHSPECTDRAVSSRSRNQL